MLLVGAVPFAALPAAGAVAMITVFGADFASPGAALNGALMQAVMISPLYGWAALALAADTGDGPRQGAWDLFRRLVPRLPSVLLAQLLSRLAGVLGLAFFLVPGVWAILALSLAAPVAAVERTGGLAALPRSSALTRGARGRMTVLLLLVAIIHLLMALLTFAATMTVAALFVTQPSNLTVFNFLPLVFLLTPLTALVTAPATAALLAAAWAELAILRPSPTSREVLPDL